uniref:Uncharacterized protein n=1 Tax=Ditylenchus dipsaci TaxID=166011 RepID=A0A915EC21_9BILA
VLKESAERMQEVSVRQRKLPRKELFRQRFCSQRSQWCFTVSSISSETLAEGAVITSMEIMFDTSQDCSTFFRCVWDRLLPMAAQMERLQSKNLTSATFLNQVKGCN